MSIHQLVQQKIYRLETLRKYQAYYGPNTPYQIIAEINQLEVELRRMLHADLTRPAQAVNPPGYTNKPVKKSKGGAKKKGTVKKKGTIKKQTAPAKATAAVKKPEPTRKGFLNGLSQPTIDLIMTVAFAGFVFLLGAILYTAYTLYGPQHKTAAAARPQVVVNAPSVLRPTFTPTLDPNSPIPDSHASDVIEVAMVNEAGLPSPNKVSTQVPTPVPTITPKPSAIPILTPTPLPTDTPAPPPPPPPPQQQPPPQPQAPLPTATPAPPTVPPAPAFPFVLREQSNRAFQHTNYHVITIYVAIVSEDNIPIGGLKVIGDHIPSGMHVESGLSDWHWSVTNCLDCDYVKFGNLKFEPGTFSDGVWSIYVTDGSGAPLSQAVPLSYSSDPNQWVWDFIIFQKSSN